MLTTYSQDAEENLLDHLAKMREAAGDYYVVHLKFSNLLEHYKNEYQLKVSVNIISDILKAAEGWVFATSDYDIFVFCRNTMPNIVNKMIFQLRYLYMDDPLAYRGEGVENPEFSKTYELKSNWPELLDIAKEKTEALKGESQKDDLAVSKEDSSSLTALKLANVELELDKINIAQAVRRQPVCSAQADGWQSMFHETYINIGALASHLKMRVDLISNRWLFKYLTQILDPKMLEYIATSFRKHLDSPIGINLNIETVLSRAFTDFDQAVEKKSKKNIVVEIQIADVFTDMQGFTQARRRIHDCGYRLCLDGLTDLSFLQLGGNSLGFDFVKILWSADLRGKRKQNKELAAAIDKCGSDRVILSRCDSPAAIRYGQSLGIPLFQGRYIDSLVDPKSEIIN